MLSVRHLIGCWWNCKGLRLHSDFKRLINKYLQPNLIRERIPLSEVQGHQKEKAPSGVSYRKIGLQTVLVLMWVFKKTAHRFDHIAMIQYAGTFS